MVGTNAVDPLVDLGRVDEQAGVEFGASFGDPVGLPRDAALPLGLGLGAADAGVVARERGGVHAWNVAMVASHCQRGAGRRRCGTKVTPRPRWPVKLTLSAAPGDAPVGAASRAAPDGSRSSGEEGQSGDTQETAGRHQGDRLRTR